MYLSPCSPIPLQLLGERTGSPKNLAPIPLSQQTGLLPRSVRALTYSIHRTLHLLPLSCLLSGTSDFLSETLSSSDFLKASSPVSPSISLASHIYSFSASSSSQLFMGLSHSSCPFVFSVCFPSPLPQAWLLP